MKKGAKKGKVTLEKVMGFLVSMDEKIISLDEKITYMDEKITDMDEKMVTKEFLNEQLKNYPTKTDFEERLKDLATKNDLEKFKDEILDEVRPLQKAVDKDAETLIDLERREFPN